MDKNYLITLIVIIAVVIAALLFFAWLPEINNSQTLPAGDGDAINNDDTAPPEGYQIYYDDNLEFSIIYPNGATLQDSIEDRVQFTFLGPDNEPATEITDGFVLTVFKDPDSTQYNSLGNYAEARTEEVRGEIVQGLELVELNGLNTQVFSHRSELGNEVIEYVFMSNNGQGYTISYSIFDLQNRGYEDIVLNMIRSVGFSGDRPVFTGMAGS